MPKMNRNIYPNPIPVVGKTVPCLIFIGYNLFIAVTNLAFVSVIRDNWLANGHWIGFL